MATGGSANSLSSTFSASLDGVPLPVSAEYTLSTQSFTCVFDQQLTPGVLAQTNWTMKQAANNRIGAIVSAAGNTVSGTTGAHLAGPLPNTIEYAMAPADVTSLLTGTPAAAFTNFPMDVVP